MYFARKIMLAALIAAGASHIGAVPQASAAQKRCHFAAFNGNTPQTSSFLIVEGGSHKKKLDKACKEAKKKCEKSLKKAKKKGIPRGSRRPECLRLN